MVLSTVSDRGQPSARIVLLKGLVDEEDRQGFVFFTNLESRKGRELAGEARCALVFPWHDMERQVRVEGVAEQLPRAEVEDYFAERPRASQLGAHASAQSQPIADRAVLEAAYAAVEELFEGADVAPPEHWGGYLIRPTLIEFWKGGPGRLHDRLEYRATPGGWSVQRLQP
jgi:pyridoxamine 5'-phosphate oxidase